MNQIIGRKPSPRILVCGFDDDEAVAEALGAIAPTVRVVQNPFEVRQAEWDLLVTGGDVPDKLAQTMYVIGIESNTLGRPENVDELESQFSALGRYQRSLASEFIIPPGLPLQLDRTVRTSLLPIVQSLVEEERLYVITEEWSTGGGRKSSGKTPPAVQPFLLTAEGLAVAGRFTRAGGLSECWSLPYEVDAVEWTRLAVDVWSERDPERFPRPEEWTDLVRWRTPAEAAAYHEQDEVTRQRQQVLDDWDRRLTETAAIAAQTTQQASINERRMLTSQGDDLVDVVAACLGELGYAVEQMDDTAQKGDLREDFRLQDATAPGWIAIVEVRGYRKGAQLADLNRLQARFKVRFVQETGKLPDRTWYVVNHSLGQDPAARQQALGSHPAEVELFGEDDGLIIETQDLYRLWMAVRRGEVDPKDARRLIGDATGRFTY